MSDPQAIADRVEIEALRGEFTDAVMMHDYDRLAALFTEDGLIFLAVGTVVGGVMASIAFAAGAFSLPLLLDRKVGVLEALVTSVVAVVLNAPAMVVWAALVVLFAAAGLALGYVGLAVTLPLLGHATWHAYRAVIRS